MNRVFAIVFVAHTLFGQTKTLVSGQTVQLTAPAVTWSVTPPVGTVSGTGLYTAPATNPTQQSIVVSAIAGSDTIVSQSITLLADTITLPIEVVGPDGTSSVVNFGVQATAVLSGSLTLSLQVHNLKYETMMSVRINQGAWTAVNTSTATLEPLAVTYGGIGGGFSTIKLTMPLPGTLTPGSNQIAFRFNGTDGRSSGFRVLAFNISNSAGNLIPAANFVWDDPAKWAAPLTTASDIAAGKVAFQAEGTLRTQLSGPTTNIKASCGDCHAQDGRDLKYFNYSNASIEARSVFHGLTAQQGAQIASYIRSLSTPAPATARPWNPPYQPGPGLDSQPVQNWAAGAGLSAVLNSDADMLPFVLPGGSAANIAWNANLNQRETPVALQLLDWNRWLPQVHPLDAFGANFSPFLAGYQKLRGELKPGNAALYGQNKIDFQNFLSIPLSQNLFATIAPMSNSSSPLWSNPLLAEEVYSFGLWGMVKLWEINQEYGLEGIPSAAFGAKAESRGWYTNQPFLTSPNFMRIPKPNPGIGNGTLVAHTYLSFIWYQLQLILNDGNGTASGTWPIDRGYAFAYLVNNLTWNLSPGAHQQVNNPTAGLYMEWFAKILQSGDPVSNDPQDANPYFLVAFPGVASTWSGTTAKASLMSAATSAWLADMQHYSKTALFTLPGISATYSAVAPGSFTGDLSYALPRLKYEGVSPDLLNQVAAWASSAWPSHAWASDLSQTCKPSQIGELICQ